MCWSARTAAEENQREIRVGKVRTCTAKRPRVYSDVAGRLEAPLGGIGRKVRAAAVVGDEHFDALFTDAAFRVDPATKRYKMLHTSGAAGAGGDAEAKADERDFWADVALPSSGEANAGTQFPRAQLPCGA